MASDSGADMVFIGADGKEYYVQAKRTSPQGLFALLCEKHGLRRDDIENMTVEQLDDAVTRLNNLEADWNTDPARNGIDSRHIEYIASMIASLRKSINERLFDLVLQQSMDHIKDAVESKVADPEIKKDLIDAVDESVKKQDEIAEARKAADEEILFQKNKLALQRERIDNIKSMFEREPAAVLVGGLLILLLTVVLVVAMFTHTTVPEILTSMVLLILGFFFGQTMSGRKSGDS